MVLTIERTGLENCTYALRHTLRQQLCIKVGRTGMTEIEEH